MHSELEYAFRYAALCSDECFFAYCEDLDYCLRAIAAGFQVALVPTRGVVHGAFERTRPEQPPPHRCFYMARKTIFLYLKDSTGWRRLRHVYWSILSSRRFITAARLNRAATDACLDGVWCGLLGRSGGWTPGNRRLQAPKLLRHLFLLGVGPAPSRRG